MKQFKIYTCGKMSGITFSKQMIWRKELQYYVEQKYEELHGTHANITFINPPDFFNYENNLHKSEREIRDWEIGQVCDSDILVVNLDGILDSIGSHFELGAVVGANISSNKNIKIIAIGEKPQDLHPWIELSWLRHETSIQDAADYIVNYLLV